MAKFLGFTDSQLLDAGLDQILTDGAVNPGRINQILLRNQRVTVVLHHAGIFDIKFGSPGKFVKFIFFKSLADLDGSIAAEIKKNNAVIFLNGPQGQVVAANDKWRKILVDDIRIFPAQRFNRLPGRSEFSTLAPHMGFPSQFNHTPVCLVAVHGYFHAAAAGGNSKINVAVLFKCR